MNGPDKMMAPVRGRPLLAYSLGLLGTSSLVDSVVLVMSRENIAEGELLVRKSGLSQVATVCEGGARRQDSVRRALEHIGGAEWVVVHDGARPCLTAELIAEGLASARDTGAAVAAVPVNDTIKSVGPDMLVEKTVDRDGLWAVQTPQVFRADLLVRAHREVSDDSTDDAAMVERIGGAVRLFMGSYENVKVTTADDLTIAAAILKARSLA